MNDINKKVLYDQLPFPESLGKRFDTIYESKNIVTWDVSVKAHEKRIELKKAKDKAKREALSFS